MSAQPGLFDMDPIRRPEAPRRKRWGGRASINARAQVRTMLPAPCTKCGGLIGPDDPESTWHADHITARAHGGRESGNLGPAHAWCNTSDGGRLGAAMTNGSRATADVARERTAKWW